MTARLRLIVGRSHDDFSAREMQESHRVSDLLHSTLRGGVRVLTLNRPETRNALSTALVRELISAIAAAENDRTVTALVLTGTAPTFCSGGDLSDIASDADAADLAVRHRSFVELAKRITSLHKPVVAAINGAAIGAGASLALACDYSVIADDASLRFAFLSVGLPPDLLSVSLLRNRAGSTVAADVLYTCAPVHADKAVHLHLIDQQASPEEVLESALAAAERLGSLPSFAFATTKTLLRHAVTLSDAMADIEPFAVGSAAASREFLSATARYRQ